ncbi:DNA-binding transcriptional LysR family regulator [Variovorax sp. TBS-050B]|uniref:LysR family transcriptional regulator n=1 Tax=Variovorax sp. TBS-050B TaxID=2940551 RepID=UPI0024739CC0|nr:LysR family transcriptional regulator [Variovorax sp. TBS-050B]MDH6590273.1 DNA-binding transcriptional LysR family regulator [Variovorax sp. TBS-050B]
MNHVSVQMLEGVDVLAAVVDTRSFGRAGEALGMSQSGVSRAVERLEARLGIRVFDRTTRSVRLTEEGRRFYEEVMPLVGALAEVTSRAAGGAAAVRGRLRVNIDPFFSSLILAPRLGALLDKHPDLEIELRSRDDLGDLVAEGFDLAIRFGHPRPSSLVARKLLDTRVLTVASPGYLRRHGHPSDPRELETQHHRCILFRDPATGRPFPWEFHQRSRRRTVAVRGSLMVNDAGTLYSSCLAGHGIAQLFELGAESFITAKKLVPLFPDWSDERFPLYAYHPSRHHVPAKTRALLDFVASLVNEAGEGG